MPAISEYFAAADRALARYRDADIFLSTDNRDVVGWFRGRYGEARVIVTDKWFAQPGQSLHKNPLCPDGIGSAQEAVVDMGLLASCDFLITLGNSSFSIVANALSVAAPDDRTILHPRNPIWWRVLRRLGLGNRG